MINKKLLIPMLLCGLVAVSTVHAQAAKPKPPKIYLMAGQSNMEGHAGWTWVKEKYPELETPRDDVWCVYAGKLPGRLRPGYGGQGGVGSAFGPELVIGQVLGDEVDNQIILFKSAKGGTRLHTDWRTPSAVKRNGGDVGYLYARMMRRFHQMLADLKAYYPDYEGQGFEIAGFVWFQGENDTLAMDDPDDPATGYWNYYEQNLRDLVADVRAEVAVPELPVLIIQIGTAPVWDRKKGGDTVRAAQKKVAEEDKNAAWVSTADLTRLAHYNSVDMITIGERAGKALLPFAKTVVKQNNKATLNAGKKYLVAKSGPGAADVNTAQLKKGLIGYWSFDEGEGTTSKDLAGEADAKLLGKPAWVKGVFGSAIRLEKEQMIEVPDYKDVVGASGNIENLTVSYWYKANRHGSGRIGKGTGEPINKDGSNWFYSPTANLTGWDVCCFDGGAGVFFTAGFNGGTKGFKYTKGDSWVISDGYDWRHVVVTYNGKDKSFEIYVSGSKAPKGGKKRGKDEFGNLDKPYWGVQNENHIIPAKDAILSFGGQIELDRQFEVFDEIAIWSRALSEDEALQLYNNGAGVYLAK